MNRFEEIVAWQKARELTASIYSLVRGNALAKDFALKDQMIRAAISIMANIAEGFERGKLTEFHQFLSIAKASCAELRSHLYVALDAGYLSIEQFELVKLKAEEVGKVLGGDYDNPLSESVTVRNWHSELQRSTQYSALSTQY